MRKLRWVLILLLAVVLGVWFLKAPVFGYYLTSKMGVPVSVANLSISSDQSKWRGFQINNPRGFKKKAALLIERTNLNYDFHKLFKDPVEFDEIVLDGVHLNIELLKGGIKNNWTVLGSKLSRNEDSTSKAVIIHKLILTDITVEISGLGSIVGMAVPKVQHFDRWEFDGIDSRHGFPTSDLVQKLFARAGVFKYLQGVWDQSLKIEKKLNPLRIFGSQPKQEPPVSQIFIGEPSFVAAEELTQAVSEER